MVYREQIIKKYFQCWLDKDALILKEVFDQRAIYSECFGPVYSGLADIERWFLDWNKHGSVMEWSIKQFIHETNMTAVEWYFKCEYDGSVEEFDGVSLIEFSDDSRIVSLKEFQSKIPHYYPFSEK